LAACTAKSNCYHYRHHKFITCFVVAVAKTKKHCNAEVIVKKNLSIFVRKKFELMLTRRAKAYSSSGSVV